MFQNVFGQHRDPSAVRDTEQWVKFKAGNTLLKSEAVIHGRSVQREQTNPDSESKNWEQGKDQKSTITQGILQSYEHTDSSQVNLFV